MSSRPVKVTAVLNGLLGADPPMLDALCERAMCSKMASVRETDKDGRHTFPTVPPGQPVPVESLGKIPIPIERRTIDGLPIALSSSPILSTVHHDTHGHYHSSFSTENASLLTEKERTKIAPSGGRFKSFRLPIRLRTLDRIVWFAMLKPATKRNGNGGRRSPMSVLRRLLNKNVTHVGKKSSYGYGQVSQWIVEEADEDYSWFAPHDDGPVLMRPLPLGEHLPDNLQGSRLDFGAVCGPYWQQDLWRERVVPV